MHTNASQEFPSRAGAAERRSSVQEFTDTARNMKPAPPFEHYFSDLVKAAEERASKSDDPVLYLPAPRNIRRDPYKGRAMGEISSETTAVDAAETIRRKIELLCQPGTSQDSATQAVIREEQAASLAELHEEILSWIPCGPDLRVW